MSKCHKCSSYCGGSCSPCDCLQQYKGKCVFYNGDNLPCINVTKGDNLEEILTSINNVICDLESPSGISTVVTSCDGNIGVTSNTSEGITTYTVCLSSDITDEIATNTSDIADLQTCVQAGVLDITSSTLDIIVTDVTDCGRTLNIEIASPTGVPTYDGIIYNNSDKSGTSGSTGDKLLKSFVHDYTTNNISVDDEIRVRATGQILGDGFNVDKVKIQLYDDNSSTLLYSYAFGGFDKINKQSWKFDADITYLNTFSGECLVNGDFLANATQNNSISNYTNNSQVFINGDITITDFTALRWRILYEHNSTSNATYNFARQLLVEVRKKI